MVNPDQRNHQEREGRNRAVSGFFSVNAESRGVIIMKVKGTNLGNWLVLEKWMNPAIFDGTKAEDETWLNRELSSKEYAARVKKHRETYITEKDFKKIAALGMNTVRLPLPYFVFGDRKPYPGCIEYVDKAFDWAEKYGLKIILDLHTTPGCQNGYDNGGIVGVCKWHFNKVEVEYALFVLEGLAYRYGHRQGLFGIEVVNEPISYLVYRFAPTTGKAADAKEAEGSAHVGMNFLKDFYLRAYRRLKPLLAPDKAIIFHDGFRMNLWGKFFKRHKMENVYLDVHPYIWAMEMFVPIHRPLSYRIYLKVLKMRLKHAGRNIPILIGEWCICNHYAVNGPKDPEKKKKRYQKVARMEMKTFQSCAGWLYWSWKLRPDGTYEGGEAWKESWDLRKAISNGWMPCRYKTSD